MVSTGLTPYMVMSIQANEISNWDNLLAATCSWITLAGYIVLPGTFTSVSNAAGLEETDGGKLIQHAVRNLPLLPVAATCCVLGSAGSFVLCRKWQRNFVWLLAKIFLPGVLYSLTGLINTLISVYTAYRGVWSITAVVTAATLGAYLFMMSSLSLFYMWKLNNVKTAEDIQLAERA